MSEFPNSLMSKEALGYGIPNMLLFTLASGVTSSGTTITVTEDAETKGLPDPSSGYMIYGRMGAMDVDDEVVRITARSGTSITAVRNIDSRGAYAHSAGDILYIVFAAEHLNAITDLLEAVQTQLLATGTAGEYLPAYRAVCYNASGELVLGDASALATSLVVGMTTTEFNQGTAAYAKRMGVINNADEWYFDSVKQLWLSATQPGVVSTFEPATGNWRACCGVTKPTTGVDFRRPEMVVQI